MESLSTLPMEYEIQPIGCNVCRQTKPEELVPSPSVDVPSTAKQTNMGAIWIILILIVLLILGVLLMRRNMKKSRK